MNVEFEAGVNRCIRQIRAALNDASGSPRYIETVPRRGYRFIGQLAAEIESIRIPFDPAASPDVFAAKSSSTHPGPLWRRRGTLAVAAILLAAGAVFVFLRQPSRRPASLKTEPLVVSQGDHYSPSFSPDGQSVAFTWNPDRRDMFDIYVKNLGSPSPPLRLTSNGDTNTSPAWSPDGRWIAFCGGKAIWLIPPLGGPPRRVADFGLSLVPFRKDLAWTTDSKSLVVTRGSELLRIDVQTGETRTLVAATGGDRYSSPAVSPYGNTVAFTREVGPQTSTTSFHLPRGPAGVRSRRI
jgi:Tol biopolymer transport system component